MSMNDLASCDMSDISCLYLLGDESCQEVLGFGQASWVSATRSGGKTERSLLQTRYPRHCSLLDDGIATKQVSPIALKYYYAFDKAVCGFTTGRGSPGSHFKGACRRSLLYNAVGESMDVWGKEPGDFGEEEARIHLMYSPSRLSPS